MFFQLNEPILKKSMLKSQFLPLISLIWYLPILQLTDFFLSIYKNREQKTMQLSLHSLWCNMFNVYRQIHGRTHFLTQIPHIIIVFWNIAKQFSSLYRLKHKIYAFLAFCKEWQALLHHKSDFCSDNEKKRLKPHIVDCG